MPRKWILTGLIAFYLLTRVFIWVNKPTTFSDVVYAFMPYAHLWAAGETPYLKHWFEYPPATIPLIYIPHLIDRATLTTPFHIDYYVAFRLQLLLVDLLLFTLIFLTLKKLTPHTFVLIGGVVYYSLITAKANHFIYDEPELYFVTAVAASSLLPLLLSQKTERYGRWISFFLATALKYINAPLGFIHAGYDLKKKQLSLFIIGLAFLLVWGFPLAYFRSSLSVSLVYHQIRGIQIESVPATIARTIDRFTHTEHAEEVFKNYDLVGPVSSTVKKVFDVLLPAALLLFLVWHAWMLFWEKAPLNRLYVLWATELYILLFMVITKVSSTPFFLLHIPLLAAFPYKNLGEQLRFTVPSFLIIVISMTQIPDLPIGIFSVHILIGWVRLVLFLYLLAAFINLKSRTRTISL